MADLMDLEGDEGEKGDANGKPKETVKEVPAEQNKANGHKDEEIVAPEFRKTSTLSIKSLGHPVGLRASYPKSWIRPYKVEITKPASWALSSQFKSRPCTVASPLTDDRAHYARLEAT